MSDRNLLCRVGHTLATIWEHDRYLIAIVAVAVLALIAMIDAGWFT